jgi:hypothetical protein
MSKPGPKPDPVRLRLRRLMSEMSDRTFATYWQAFGILGDLKAAGAITDGQARAATAAAIRPNGTLNVCKFARNADALLVEAMRLHPELFTTANERTAAV